MKASPSNLIGGVWEPLPGDVVVSRNPARPDEVVWAGSPRLSDVGDAVADAREAFLVWSRWSMDARAAVLRTFQRIAREREGSLAELLCDEVGKVLWDAKAEAGLLAAKVDVTLDAGPEGTLRRVTPYDVALSPTRRGRCDFRPHGVMAVLGPFNFPAHLPNGHIVPALLLGNTIVFKPSDKAPAVGQFLAKLFEDALHEHDAPPGVFNLVHGGADVAAGLASHRDIDGVLFTGSWAVGRKIMQANLDRPGRMLALEMGGNNPAIIMPGADLRQALIECVRSAFISSGQRCTCTRRIIVHESIADRFLPALCKAAGSIIVGDPRAAHPVFMGPVISEHAMQDMLYCQTAMQATDGVVLVPCSRLRVPGCGGWFVSPGVVRVDEFTTLDDLRATPGADHEVFGPLVRVAVAKDFEHALDMANATRFGLAASLFSKDEREIDEFLHGCRAGCLNINTGTAGASSKLPFGGLGLSGNHRPAGAFSVDYCAYPVGSMVESGGGAVVPVGMEMGD